MGAVPIDEDGAWLELDDEEEDGQMVVVAAVERTTETGSTILEVMICVEEAYVW